MTPLRAPGKAKPPARSLAPTPQQAQAWTSATSTLAKAQALEGSLCATCTHRAQAAEVVRELATAGELVAAHYRPGPSSSSSTARADLGAEGTYQTEHSRWARVRDEAPDAWTRAEFWSQYAIAWIAAAEALQELEIPLGAIAGGLREQWIATGREIEQCIEALRVGLGALVPLATAGIEVPLELRQELYRLGSIVARDLDGLAAASATIREAGSRLRAEIEAGLRTAVTAATKAAIDAAKVVGGGLLDAALAHPGIAAVVAVASGVSVWAGWRWVKPWLGR